MTSYGTPARAASRDPDDDPFNWSIEKVISVFAPENTPSARRFAESLDFNEVDGRTLLVTASYETLKNDLGVMPLGKRERIMAEVAKLRNRSHAFHEHVRELAIGIPLPVDVEDDWPLIQPMSIGSPVAAQKRKYEDMDMPQVDRPNPYGAPAQPSPPELPLLEDHEPKPEQGLLKVHDPNPEQGPMPSIISRNDNIEVRTPPPSSPFVHRRREPLELLARSDQGGEPLYINDPFAGRPGRSVGIEPDGEMVDYSTGMNTADISVTGEFPSLADGVEPAEERDQKEAAPLKPRRVQVIQIAGPASELGNSGNIPAVDPVEAQSPEGSDMDLDGPPSPSQGARKRRSRKSYFPPKARPIDDLFYDVHVGQVMEDKDEDREFFLSQSELTPGERRYVAHRMRAFFNKNNIPVKWEHKNHLRTVVKPYSDTRSPQFLRKHDYQSFTVYDTLPSGEVEVRRQSAKTVPRAVRQAFNATQSDSQTVTFAEPDPAKTLLSLTDNSNHDWDYLLKWQETDQANEVLPAFGDSGSENEYDAETWREYQEEYGPKEKPKCPSRRKPLELKEVAEALDEGISETITNWKTKHLPKLELKAFSKWKQAVKQKMRKKTAASSKEKIEELENRLKKLKEEIMKASIIWTKRDDVKKQCRGSLEPTIFDIQELKWIIRLMQQKKPPDKPPKKLRPRKKIQNAEASGAAEAEDDSISLGSETEHDYDEDEDTDMADFIVDDENDIPMSEAVVDHELDNQIQAQLAREAEADAAMEDSELEDDQPLMQRQLKEKATKRTPQAAEKPPTPVSPAPSPPVKHEPSSSRDANKSLERQPASFIDLTSSPPRPKPSQSPSMTDPGRRRKSVASIPTIDVSDDDGNNDGDDQPPSNRSRHHVGTNAQRADKIRADNDHSKKKPTPKLPRPQMEDPAAREIRRKEKIAAEKEAKKKANELTKKKRFCTLKSRSRLLHALVQEKRDQDGGVIVEALFARIEDLEQERDPEQTVLSEAYNMTTAIIKQIHKDTLRHIPGGTEYGITLFKAFAELYCCYELLLPEKPTVALKYDQFKQLDDRERFRGFLRALKREVQPDDASGEKHLAKKQKTVHGSSSRTASHNRRGFGESDHSDEVEEDDEDEAQPSSQHRKRPRPEFIPSVTARQNREKIATLHKNLHKRIQNRQRQDDLRRLRGEVVKEPVNLGHYQKFADIFFHEQIDENLKPHQVDGIRFMWQQLIPATPDDENIQSQGVLLAHTMGLGKTFQIIALLHTIATAGKSPDPAVFRQIPEELRESKTLILAPPGLVENWWDEFHLWVPTIGEGYEVKLDLSALGQIYKIHSGISVDDRVQQMETWYKHGGIVIMGYQMFRGLVLNSKRNKFTPERHQHVKKMLLEGPNIVVADEAHAMKNDNSQINAATSQFRTKSRIAMTGSPLSNSLAEYYTTIEWIHPGYLGNSKTEFNNAYVLPITDGLFSDSSREERRQSAKMLRVLKNDLKLKMHRAGVDVIKDDLPPKIEYRIKIGLTELQTEMYIQFINNLEANQKAKGFFDTIHLLSMLCNHPFAFVKTLEERERAAKATIDKAKKAGLLKSAAEPKDPDDTGIDADDEELMNLDLEFEPPRMAIEEPELYSQAMEKAHEWSRRMLDAVEAPQHVLSYRTKALKVIIDTSLKLKEKVLVFSQSIRTLDLIEQLLADWKIPCKRLDGATKMKLRQTAVKDFNASKEDVSVFLISTQAGGLGLNLPGANRVVIFDFKWTPVNEEQAVGRAYRIGQKKHVYVYRFQTLGTHEVYMHNKNAVKRILSNKVIEDQSIRSEAQKEVQKYLALPRPVVKEDLTSFKGRDKVLDTLIEEDPAYVAGIEYTETFAPDPDDDLLTAEDLKETDEWIAKIQKMRVDPQYQHRMFEDGSLYAMLNRSRAEEQQNLFAQSQMAMSPGQVISEMERLNAEAERRQANAVSASQPPKTGLFSKQYPHPSAAPPASSAPAPPARPASRFGLDVKGKSLPSLARIGDRARNPTDSAGANQARGSHDREQRSP